MNISEEKQNISLRAVNLEKSFKERKVVDKVNLQINRGEIVGLLGPNGAGKSTSFYMITGRILPDSGNVYIGGEDISSLPMYRRARMGIGYLPQEPSIFRRLTVNENLELVFRERGLPKNESASAAEKLIDEFRLEAIVHAPGYALSGGERRRVEIARCLAMEPHFILLDEPFSGIDPVAVCDLQEIIEDLRNKGYGILLTDHNVRETLSITDRTYLLHRGEVVVEGHPVEVAKDPLARKYYLGERFTW